MNIIEFAEKYSVFYDPLNGWKYGNELQDYEKDFLCNLVEHKFTINLHSRQMNITTLNSIYVTYNLIFGTDEKIIYVGNKLDCTYHFIDKVRQILFNYNQDNKDLVINNKKEIRLKNGNKLIGISANSYGIIGYTPTKVLIDSATYINGFEHMLNAILCSLTTFGSLHIFAQPNRLDYVYQLYVSDNNNFKKFKYHYSLNPKRFSVENINKMKTHISDDEWKQSMELEFLLYEPKEYTLQVRVDNQIYNKISKRLMERDISLSEYLRKLIGDDLQHLR
jgi:hypothetical protein